MVRCMAQLKVEAVPNAISGAERSLELRRPARRKCCTASLAAPTAKVRDVTCLTYRARFTARRLVVAQAVMEPSLALRRLARKRCYTALVRALKDTNRPEA